VHLYAQTKQKTKQNNINTATMIYTAVLYASRGQKGPLSGQQFREGFHASSRYWQNYKQTLPALTPFQFSAALGISLGDSGLSKANAEASMKVEQGYQQLAFVLHLFSLFAGHCFMVNPSERIEPASSSRAGKVKSYWFRTFACSQFTALYQLLYTDNLKCIKSGLVTNYVDAVALAYWFMSDASLSGNSVTLHSQSFTETENRTISSELNLKFGLHSKVVQHKNKYWVIRFPGADGPILRKLVGPYVISSLQYKIPQNL
jgi:hypothetical protein